MEDVMKHADTFESTLRDHTHLQDTSEMMAARTSQYKRQFKSPINHCPSPFQLACQVPPNTFDAVDGYHAIPLDDESQHFTTFITEWGRYGYLRMPQGFKASGDAYTSHYDE